MATQAPGLTFAGHIHELRKRLMWSFLFVVVGAGIGYALHGPILRILQEPLSESLYYTAPTGAFSFVIKVCFVFGFIFALPVVVYQVFAFFGPLLRNKAKKLIVWFAFLSVLLASLGILFAYFISLPAALHFLVNFGRESADIQALITADEYFNFVLAYIAGFAALFQLPLIISFVNKVKPLKPAQLLGGTRYVVLGSFVIAALITPTPDPLNQALMAGPIILLYFMSAVITIATNAIRGRSKTKKTVQKSVPETRPVDNEFVLANKLSLQAHQPEAQVESVLADSVPNQRPATTIPARSSVQKPQRAMDMVVPRSKQSAQVISRQQRPVRGRQAPLTREQLGRSQVRTGVISDFVPVSD